MLLTAASFRPCSRIPGANKISSNSIIQLPGARYENVKSFVLDGINSGRWPPNAQIPSENELVGELGVSRMTVHRALRELTEEGILVRVRGVGTFVARNKPISAYIEVKELSEEIRSLGHVHTNKIIACEAIKAGREVAMAMGVVIGTRLFFSRIVHMENGVPVQLDDRYILPSLAPDYLKQDFSMGSPHHYLVKVLPVTEAENIVQARFPDAECSKLLEISEQEPCIHIIRRNWVGKETATLAYFTYPGSRYSITSRNRSAEASSGM